MGAIFEAEVSAGLEADGPFTDDGRAGVKTPCCWFHAVRESVLNHLVAPLLFIFAVSHDLAILVWAHAVIEPPLIGQDLKSSIMCPFSFSRLLFSVAA